MFDLRVCASTGEFTKIYIALGILHKLDKVEVGGVYYIIDFRQLRSLKSALYRNCERPTFGIYKYLPPDSLNKDTVSDRHSGKAIYPSCIAEKRITKKIDIKMQ